MTQDRDIGEFINDVGISSAKLLVQDSEINLPPSKLPPSQRKEFIENALSSYVQQRNAHYSATNRLEWTNVGIKVGSGLAIFVHPPLAIPAILYAGSMDFLIDEGNSRIEKWGQERALNQLSVISEQLIADTGASDLSDLQENKSQEVVSLLKNSDRYLLELKQRAQEAGDPGLVDQATDWLISSLQNTDIELIKSTAQLNTDVQKVEQEFSKFSIKVNSNLKEISRDLDEYERVLQTVSGDLRDLKDSMSKVDIQLKKMESRQSHVEDFLISRMTPGEKLESLKNGIMRDRLRCPNGEQNCNNEELRASLIDQTESEIRVASHIDFAKTLSKGIGDVSSIAQNLGINDPTLNDVLNVGNAAANAFVGFASGDYLGAISAITGVFGKKKDPDAERFKIMMAYLQKQFEVVNAKLDKVIENQALIYDTIIDVAEILLERLDRIDRQQQTLLFEQRRTSLGVRSIHWKDWRSTRSIYASARERSPSDGSYLYTHAESGLFNNYQSLLAVAQSNLVVFRDCFSVIAPLIGSQNAIDWFGSFADARLLVDEQAAVPEGMSVAELDDLEVFRSELQKFIEGVFSPTFDLVLYWASERGISPATLYSVLTWPCTDRATGQEAFEFASGIPFQCFVDKQPYGGTHEFLCQSDDDPNDIAKAALSIPLVADSLIEISDWLGIVGQIADVFLQDNESFPEKEALLSVELDGSGKGIIAAAVNMLNQGIASYNMIFGWAAISAILDRVESDGIFSSYLIGILEGNPYLARNFGIFYLQNRWEKNADISGNSRISKSTIYHGAISAFQDRGDLIPLENLFGTDLKFIRDGEQLFFVVPGTGDEKLKMPIPNTTEFIEGRLSLPRSYSKLIAKRDQMVDRLAGYHLANELSRVDSRELADLVFQ